TRFGDCFSSKAFKFHTPSGIFTYAPMRRPRLPRLAIGDFADRETLAAAPPSPTKPFGLGPPSPAVRERDLSVECAAASLPHRARGWRAQRAGVNDPNFLAVRRPNRFVNLQRCAARGNLARWRDGSQVNAP